MQKVIHYWKYFFFFCTRFNPLLAILMLYDEIKGERKYGLSTTGFERPSRLKEADFAATSAFSYMPSNYVLIEKLFSQVNLYKHNKTFLDIGCGKGRILTVAAHYGFKEITGVELVPEYCKIAQKGVNEASKKFPDVSFQIACKDATQYYIPHHIQCIFLYNPFKEVLIDVLISNILNSFHISPRAIYIIYLNPLFKQNFISAGFTEVFQASRYSYIKASILCLTNEH